MGLPIAISLSKAIEESRIAIIVFSENFASSSWCLNEVAYILHCTDETGQIVVPIFYNVEPSEVRKQSGRFRCSFEERLRYDKNTVELWRNALVRIADLPGWTVGHSYDYHEPVLIKKVVDSIWSKLFPYKDQNEIGTRLHHLKLSALDQHQILTYMDNESDIFDPLRLPSFKAIEESRISIIIFSENYARSSWCLDELAYMMKRRNEREQIVIPIFYHVDPTDVRRQRGPYAEAFSKHELKDPSKIELWRKSLEEASGLSGLDIREIADGYEAKGIQLIVEKISKILSPDKDLIGLQTRLEDMKYGGGMITVPSSSPKDLEVSLGRCTEAILNSMAPLL
ncbi:hypothetical protein L1987_79376 [Smallanthus sonchifolius]|uniref:Uncharacterized protein n=1 Tax=Smallanthus sonchifolius TaxID=185202 RepID=A0ACB8ZEZ3_9ASTR|nr:hypothetical protein L1987_79376 [Smallanthus sonchifolius]